MLEAVPALDYRVVVGVFRIYDVYAVSLVVLDGTIDIVVVDSVALFAEWDVV